MVGPVALSNLLPTLPEPTIVEPMERQRKVQPRYSLRRRGGITNLNN